MAETKLDDLARELKPLYRKGADAAQRDNFDYAIALFTQVLEKEPGCYEVRAALRDVQQKKSGGGATGFFKKMMSGAGSSPQLLKGKAALSKNPLEAIAIAEQILTGDPNSSQAHRLLADAATAAEMPHTAALSLEVIAKNSPNDKTLQVEFANALARTGDSARAERIIRELVRTYPNDMELLKEMKNISALKTLDEGGYEKLGKGQGEGSYRDILRNKEEAISLEQEKRAQKTEDVTGRLIGEYEARLRTEGHNLKLIRSLAELYTEKKQFDRALEYYARVKEEEMGNDPSLDKAIAETYVRKFEAAIGELNPFDADHAERAAAINAEKIAYQLAECQQRVDKYPTDLYIRFEMGVLFFEAGKVTEAISEFQKAQQNPHKRIPALNYLAQCFSHRGMNDSAVRTLQNALREKQVFDDEKKELTYQLACIFEKMGKRNEALEQFTTIYETDIGYKDVGAKVDAFYAGQ